MIYGLQKASLSKRFFAFILDIIIIAIFTTGGAFVASKIFDTDGHQAKIQEKYEYYEKEYNVKFNISKEELNALSSEERAHYEEVEKIIQKDEDFVKEYQLIINLTFVVLMIGLFIGVMITEFVIPLILKNGQTVGKKVFSLTVIKQNCVRASVLQLFVRAFIGKFVIAFIIPSYVTILLMYGIVNVFWLIGIIALALFQIILFFATQNHTFIHDILSFTVVSDKQTQMIFANEQELIEYKEATHRKKVSKETY